MLEDLFAAPHKGQPQDATAEEQAFIQDGMATIAKIGPTVAALAQEFIDGISSGRFLSRPDLEDLDRTVDSMGMFLLISRLALLSRGELAPLTATFVLESGMAFDLPEYTLPPTLAEAAVIGMATQYAIRDPGEVRALFLVRTRAKEVSPPTVELELTATHAIREGDGTLRLGGLTCDVTMSAAPGDEFLRVTERRTLGEAELDGFDRGLLTAAMTVASLTRPHLEGFAKENFVPDEEEGEAA